MTEDSSIRQIKKSGILQPGEAALRLRGEQEGHHQHGPRVWEVGAPLKLKGRIQAKTSSLTKRGYPGSCVQDGL